MQARIRLLRSLVANAKLAKFVLTHRERSQTARTGSAGGDSLLG
jgi:hypothetical protein